jgi:MFS family permease
MLRARLRAATGGLPPVFWVLWAGVLLNRAASFVLGFLALFLVQERGFETAAAGRLVALYGVGGVVAALVGGVLADRAGRRATLLWSLAGSAAAVGAMAVARSPTVLALLTFAAGATGQMYPPALNAAVADVVPFADRPRAFGLTYWASNVGFGIGFATAAAVSPHSLPALFVLDALTTLAFLALVALRVPETRPAHVEHAPALPGLLRVFSDGPFVAFLALTLVALMVFAQFELVFPVDLAAHGVGRGVYAGLMGLNCALAIVLQPVLGPLLRADPTRSLAVSALALGLGYGLGALGGPLPVYVLGVVLWTAGEVTGLPVASALAASLAPPALRGRYQGAYVTTFSAALTLSPLVSGELAQRAGARAVWLACIAAGVLVALGHLAAAGPRRRRLAQRAQEADEEVVRVA